MLENRNGRDALTAWRGLERFLPLHATIAPMAVCAMGWPNGLFIPDDPVLSLFAEPDCLSMQSVVLLGNAERVFQIESIDFIDGRRISEQGGEPADRRAWTRRFAGRE